MPPSAERAELRRLVRAALDGLNPAEREVIELGLRHDLHGADLAAVLGVPRNQAHALASRARGQLEKALGALLVARTGRRACPELDMLLDGWDGRLTLLARKRVSRHIDQCDVCTDRKRGALRPAALYGMTPLAALPHGLREEVLGLCADVSPEGQSYRREVTQRASPFRPNGFPQPASASRSRMLALSGVAAAVGVLIAVVATGIITVLALTGSHTPRSAAAGRSGHPSGTASASVTASPGSAAQAVAEPVSDHERAGRHQRAAARGAAFRLADQGQAVAVGHVIGAGVPDTDAEAAHTHTHAHVYRHADAHLHLHLHGHRHAVAYLHVPVKAAAPGALWLPAYFVLVSA